ncbi:hypothetical protein RQP46_008347 [Phenoliferia psychrophenolica]
MFARGAPPPPHPGHPGHPHPGMSMGLPNGQSRAMPLPGSAQQHHIGTPPRQHLQYPPQQQMYPQQPMGGPGQPMYGVALQHDGASRPHPMGAPGPAGAGVGPGRQFTVEQAISQSLPPGSVPRNNYAVAHEQLTHQPRPAPPPSQHPFRGLPPSSSAPPRSFDSPPQYLEHNRPIQNGAHDPHLVGGPVASSSHPVGPQGGGPSPGHREPGAGGDDQRVNMYDPHRRVPTGQQPVEPEPSHRVLFHSYILDYLQKQGFHATAAAFLQDAPDTNVRRPTTADRASHKGKGRAFPDDELKANSSDFETNSPLPPRGASGDDLNSPGGIAVGADSIASTNSSLSNYGFGAAQSNGTSPPQSSPESAHIALQPRALVQIETREGFLYEWWAVFWDVFRARSNKGGTPSARNFVEVSNATIDGMAQRRNQISYEQPLSLGEIQQVNPTAFMPPHGLPHPSHLQHRPTPPRGLPQDPNAPPGSYPLGQRRSSLGGQPPPGMVPRGPPALPAQMTPAQEALHNQNVSQARFRQGGVAPPPPQGPPPPAAVSRQISLARRGAISPLPLPVLPSAQGPDQAAMNRQRQLAQQDGARQAQQQAQQAHQQQMQAQAQHQQQQHQMHQQQMHSNAQNANDQARYNAQYQQQEVQRAQAAQQAMQQAGRFSRPSSALGHTGVPPPQRQPSQASNHGSPYPQPGEIPLSPNKSYAIPQNGMMDPNRQKYPPGYGTPQSGFSPQPQAIEAYRAHMSSQALAGMQQSATSPRLDAVGSPYLQDRPTPTPNGLPQGGPSPSPYPYLGHGTPDYAPGGSTAFREQQQGGSMPPPPPAGQQGRRAQQPGSNAPTPQAAQAPTPQAMGGQTPGASQYGSPGVTPQTPNTAAAAVPAGKRKRESTKDTRENKKVRLYLHRLLPATLAGEYTQSPPGMLEATSPRLALPETPAADTPADNPSLQSEPVLMPSSSDQFQPEEMQLMFNSSQGGYEPQQAADSSYDYTIQGSEGTYHDPLGFQQSLGFEEEGGSFDFADYMNFPDAALAESQDTGGVF